MTARLCKADCSPLTCITSRGKASMSFGSVSRQFVRTLLGYQNSWLALTAGLGRHSGFPYGPGSINVLPCPPQVHLNEIQPVHKTVGDIIL